MTVLWYAPESASSDQGSLGAAAGSIPIELPVRRQRVAVVSLEGGVTERGASGGRLALKVGPSPVYVIERRGG